MPSPNYLRTYGQRRMSQSMPAPTTCRYIAGERPYGDHPWCDAPTVKDSSYCAEHHAVCFVPLDERKALAFNEWAARSDSKTYKYG